MTRLRIRALLLLLTTCLLSAAACGGGGTSYAGIVVEPFRDVSALTLPDATAGGAPLSFAAEPGGLRLVYFGYTACPDVCPTTLADIRTALDGLDATQRAHISLVMTTIDPARDRPDVIAKYVTAFVSGAHAAQTDDAAALRAVADRFGADYAVTTAADGSVEVMHTAFVYVVDEHGRVRLLWPFGTKGPDMRRDLGTLLRHLDI